MSYRIAAIVLPLALIVAASSLAQTQAQDKKASNCCCKVVIVAASGKTADAPNFGEGTEHLKAAFKHLAYKDYKLISSTAGHGETGKPRKFKVTDDVSLEVTPKDSKKGYRAGCTIWRVETVKGKDGKDTEKKTKLLGSVVNCKKGSSFVVGDLADLGGKGINLLVVVTLAGDGCGCGEK
jgi:hypothetical protein